MCFWIVFLLATLNFPTTCLCGRCLVVCLFKSLVSEIEGKFGRVHFVQTSDDGNVQPLYSAHLHLVSSEYLWLCNIQVHGNLKNEYIYLLIVHTTSDIEGKYADWNFIRMVGKFASFLKPSLHDSKRFISCRLMNIILMMVFF